MCNGGRDRAPSPEVTSNGGAHEAPQGRPASGYWRRSRPRVLGFVYRAQEDLA
jgi:hypothetical protein